ncbi:MAG TPA: cytochrome c [Candidatus Cybelea sp.]
MGESPPRAPLDPVSIALYLDDDADPIGTYRPPANVTIDTTKLSDGSHVLHIHAVDATGISGVRDVPFVVANGPGITVTGLRAGSRVRGAIHFDVNAFGANEPFDPVRAESVGPIPAWTWVLVAIVLGWAAWYGLEYFQTPAAFAQTPTYAPNPALAAANAPATTASAPAQQLRGTRASNVAGFDYGALGASTYAQNCQACHGEAGMGVPATFPALAGDPVVTSSEAQTQIRIVLHGLSNKVIKGTRYGAQMPAFASQLSDAQIAAVIDHERTSWSNNAPLVTPDQVKRLR